MERKHRTSLNDSGACRRSSWWLDILQILVLLLPYIFWVLKPAIQIGLNIVSLTLFLGQKGEFLTSVVSYVSVSQDVLFWPITPISDGQSGEQCEMLHPGMSNWNVLTVLHHVDYPNYRQFQVFESQNPAEDQGCLSLPVVWSSASFFPLELFFLIYLWDIRWNTNEILDGIKSRIWLHSW